MLSFQPSAIPIGFGFSLRISPYLDCPTQPFRKRQFAGKRVAFLNHTVRQLHDGIVEYPLIAHVNFMCCDSPNVSHQQVSFQSLHPCQVSQQCPSFPPVLHQHLQVAYLCCLSIFLSVNGNVSDARCVLKQVAMPLHSAACPSCSYKRSPSPPLFRDGGCPPHPRYGALIRKNAQS